MSSVTWAVSCHPGCPNKKWLGFKTVSSRWSAPPYFNGLEFIKASTLIEVCTPSLVGPALYKDHHGWWLLIAIENTPHSGQSSAGLVYRLSDRSTLALSKTSPISFISFRERTPSQLLQSISSVSLFPLSVMSQKSKQKSRSKRISTVAASSAVRALRSIPRRRTSPWACLRASFAFRKKTTTFG